MAQVEYSANSRCSSHYNRCRHVRMHLSVQVPTFGRRARLQQDQKVVAGEKVKTEAEVKGSILPASTQHILLQEGGGGNVRGTAAVTGSVHSDNGARRVSRKGRRLLKATGYGVTPVPGSPIREFPATQTARNFTASLLFRTPPSSHKSQRAGGSIGRHKAQGCSR